MTMIRHELRQSRFSLLIWTLSIGFLLAVCVFMFPEMKNQMDDVSSMFASMGSFTEAFGMDRLNFGTLIGFYAVECGNIVGLGGAFFSAMCASNALSKEEKDRTAEFLLTHPIKRSRIVLAKLVSVFAQITVMNLTIYIFAVISMIIVGEEIPWSDITLLHIAYFFMQIEIAGICFGISAFIRSGSAGTGLGIAIIMYFVNIVANISESAQFLKYFTPFGYCEGADIIADGKIDGVLLLIGMLYCAAGIVAAFAEYARKDIK